MSKRRYEYPALSVGLYPSHREVKVGGIHRTRLWMRDIYGFDIHRHEYVDFVAGEFRTGTI